MYLPQFGASLLNGYEIINLEAKDILSKIVFITNIFVEVRIVHYHSFHLFRRTVSLLSNLSTKEITIS